MVRKGGLEPPRSCDRQPLKLVRLPVPPLPHERQFSVISSQSSVAVRQPSVPNCALRGSLLITDYRQLTTPLPTSLPVRASRASAGRAPTWVAVTSRAPIWALT